VSPVAIQFRPALHGRSFPTVPAERDLANDAILGGAVSLTAKNSRKLGLSNYDVTFFAAFDNVDNAGILGRTIATPTSMA